jgi:tryptophan synthase alpha chain
VGFGIHTAQQVAEVGKIADGAIVGSAFVRRMTQNLGRGADGIAAAVGEYCRELLKA